MTHEHEAGAIPAGGCAAEQVEWVFQLTLTARQLKKTDAVPLLLHVVNHLVPGEERFSGKLFLVLSELFNNALDHGLLKLDSDLKHSRNGFEHYLEERAARLGRMEQGEIHFRLRKVADKSGQCIKIDVRDSGAGFNHEDVSPRLETGVDQAHHGRGIDLVRNICGAMRYSGNGSEVHVCLPIGGTQCGIPDVHGAGIGLPCHGDPGVSE